MTPQDTMRLALEALEYHTEQTRPIHQTNDAIEALKAALAQQGERQPVAYLRQDGKHVVLADALKNYPKPNRFNTPLYAGAAPAAKSLSIEEVEQINAQWNYELHGDRTRYIARMVEMKHGIGI